MKYRKYRATGQSCQYPTSIREAGEAFLSQLLRYFENDRPDVRELEDNAARSTAEREVGTQGRDTR